MSMGAGMDWLMIGGYLVLLVLLALEVRKMMKDDDDDWPPH